MTFLQHQAAFFKAITSIKSIKTTHVSLYVTLLQHWLRNRCKNPIGISRSDIMADSKIASIATYHKCIVDLTKLGFITYQPSYNPHSGTAISILPIESHKTAFKMQTTHSKNEQVIKPTCSKNEQVKNDAYIYNNITNNNKDIYMDTPVQKLNMSVKKEKTKKSHTGHRKFSIPTIDEVKLYFEESKSTIEEANRFYNYYSANGWLVGGGKTPMKDWHAAARNWILNSKNFRPKETRSTGPGNLHVNNDKNYSEPL